MLFRPFVWVRGRRYFGRLNVIGFGADSIKEIATEFDSPEGALSELVARLRHMFQVGDLIIVRGVMYEDPVAAEVALRASLPKVRQAPSRSGTHTIDTRSIAHKWRKIR